MPSVMWFRRNLRLGDNPALLEAAADGEVLPLFVLDPALWGPAGPTRRAHLGASLRALDGTLRQREASLAVVRGDPVRRVVLAAREVGATRVHVAADYGPYGHRRDREVEQALADAGVELVRTGSPYAVAPGRVTNGSGDPYKVFTPFSKAWADHGWRGPADAPTGVSWLRLAETTDIPDPTLPEGITLPEAGEAAARRRWQEFLEDRVTGYAGDRDRPGVDGTSRMSVHLKWGEIHPRTMLPTWRGTAATAPRRTARSSPGGSSTPTSSPPGPTPPASTCARSSRGWRTTSRPSSSRPGSAVAPASPSSTPGCASCARPAGCTTGCG